MQTTVSYADVTAVLVSAVENLILELMRGNQVEFGDLGKFRLQIGSDGADRAADFKSDTHIKGVNIQYSPGVGTVFSIYSMLKSPKNFALSGNWCIFAEKKKGL